MAHCNTSRSLFGHLPNNLISLVAGFMFFQWLSGADGVPSPLLLAKLAET